MLISDHHRVLYQQYYAAHPPCVLRPHRWQPLVERLVQATGALSILDYGCGPAANLARFAPWLVHNYDPGVPEFAGAPAPADLVVCMHALEHVEPDCLGAVLAHLRVCTSGYVLVVVSCQSSTKLLPDGTPWHTCVHNGAWWQTRLQSLGAEILRIADDDMPTQSYGGLYRREDLSYG